MFKRNKVQGKHAAHAKQDSVKPEKKGKYFDIPTLKPQEEEVQSVEATQELDAPIPEVSAAPTVAMPAIVGAPKPKPSIADIPDIAVPVPVAEQGTVRLGALPDIDSGATAPAYGMGDAGSFPFGSNQPLWTAAPEEKKPVNKKKIAIVLGAIVGALLLIYLIGAAVFAGRFYPNTEINGQDISMMSIDDVAALIDKAGSEYSVHVEGEGLSFDVSSADMGVKVDGAKVAKAAHDQVPSMGWPVYMFGKKDLASSLAAEYNAGGLKDIVDAKVEEWNAEATDPTNATMVYNEESNQFEVAPEAVGTKLDPEKVLEEVDKAVIGMKPEAKITEDQLLQPTVFSDDERLAKACETANGYISADIKLKMDGNDAGEINSDQISSWVYLNDDLEAVFDDGAMDAWLRDFGNSLDTVGSQRTFTRADGKEVTVEGGTYGWEVDTEALVNSIRDSITSGYQGDLDVPVIVAGVYYNPENGVDWADYIDVDLSEQHARFYNEAGDILWESDVVTGRPDGEHDTPTGVWTLFSMESPATLKGDIQVATGQPEYETKVQYWMPFTYTGCGFHDATWQPAFGGSLYAQGLGSHGCVNLPYDAAGALFEVASVGLPVVVHW